MPRQSPPILHSRTPRVGEGQIFFGRDSPYLAGEVSAAASGSGVLHGDLLRGFAKSEPPGFSHRAASRGRRRCANARGPSARVVSDISHAHGASRGRQRKRGARRPGPRPHQCHSTPGASRKRGPGLCAARCRPGDRHVASGFSHRPLGKGLWRRSHPAALRLEQRTSGSARPGQWSPRYGG